MEDEEGIPRGKFGALARKIRGGESENAKHAKSEPASIFITRRQNATGAASFIPVVGTLVRMYGHESCSVAINDNPGGNYWRANRRANR